MESQLRWSVHVMLMEDNQFPKQQFCSELARGDWKQGHPIKQHKDSLKQSMRACNIPVTAWEALAANRTAWRQCTVSGVRSFEEQRLDQLDAKRQARKNRSVNLSAGVACPVCGRICASEFGLRSHQRCH